MRTPQRAAVRLVLTGWLALIGLSALSPPSSAATPPEKVLPSSTILFVKINDAAGFRESFRQSQFGQLWADPALKPFRDDLAEKLDDGGKLKGKLGVSLRELIQLPQGPVSLAVVGRDDPKVPMVLLLTADAGKNAQTMADVLARASAEAEKSGAKVATEPFQGATLHVVQFPPEVKDKKENNAKDQDKDDKDKPKDADKDRPNPPIVWAQQGSVFVLGSDVAGTKDLLAHASGRDDSLTSNESYTKAQSKLGSDGQLTWFVDTNKLIKLVIQIGSATKQGAGQGAQAEAMLEVVGLNGLKAIAGTLGLNVGDYDSLSKILVLAPAPTQGLLKVFQLSKAKLRPEPWVPATVSIYRTYSWKLGDAFKAINDLANKFQPGLLNVLEQQLVGPNGGEPLSFQKDVFGPLGDRITLVTDFKKPIKEENQRRLLAVALKDPKTFQQTLNKLIDVAGGEPKKREFQGTTILDFDMPNLPNANANANLNLKGQVSVAVAKNSLFVATEPTLLEQVLRGGGPSLADSREFQAVAREIPPESSSLTYVRPDESARLSYELLKSGQFEKALQQAAVAAGNRDAPKLDKPLIDKEKLPDFSVFAKYLSPGGGYGLQGEDGTIFTNFTLRKKNP